MEGEKGGGRGENGERGLTGVGEVGGCAHGWGSELLFGVDGQRGASVERSIGFWFSSRPGLGMDGGDGGVCFGGRRDMGCGG